MSEPPLDGWAERLTLTARALPYPPTPNLARGISQRRGQRPARAALRPWQVAALALAVILLGLLAVPSVRAGVASFIQIGVVRILLAPATPTPAASPTPAPSGAPRLTATPPPSPTAIAALLDSLSGETTLANAQANAGFAVRLPAYPSDLGSPDWVFLQDDGAPMVVLVWVDPAQPGQARLALFEIAPGNVGLEKSEFNQGVPPSLQNATVHGQPAAWTTGPYLLDFTGGNLAFTRLIDGHVLIWLDNDLTYRLEMGSGATLDEAVRIAESLK